MSSFFQHFVGPRVPSEELRRRPGRYALPTIILAVARVLLLVSVFVPYWHMDLDAPQYPNGLQVTAYVNHLEGDVKEINGLNHYIGMKPLEQAAQHERALSVWLILGMFLLVECAAFVHSKWAVLLAVPAVMFPVGFLADLGFWLRAFGQNLDPHAPLSAAVKPFTPTILGEGGIGQFKTYAEAGLGLWMASACSVLTVLAFVFHRRAYRPLFKAAAARAGDGSCVRCAA